MGRGNPGAAPVAYPLAAAAALVQIPRKAHFASDVAVGVVIGLVAEAVSSRLLARLWR